MYLLLLAFSPVAADGLQLVLICEQTRPKAPLPGDAHRTSTTLWKATCFGAPVLNQPSSTVQVAGSLGSHRFWPQHQEPPPLQ